MMKAVAKRVILEEELARQRRVGVQRDRRGAVERFVADGANCGRCRPAVALEKIERLRLLDGGMLSRVLGVQLVDGVPCHAGDRLAAANV